MIKDNMKQPNRR